MSPLAKPTQIQHTQTALVVDDYIVPRVTSLGVSGDLQSESIEELGNANIVETLDDTPVISTTVDSNDFGSVETLATFANLIRKPLANEIVGDAWDSTYWEVDATHFETAAVDLLNPVKTAAGNIHTSWFNNCQIQSYSATYSVDGFATESVSLENSAQYVFLNGFKYARVLVPACHNLYDGTSAKTVSLASTDVPDGTLHYNDLGDLFKGKADSTGLYLTKNGVIQLNAYWAWDTTSVSTSASGRAAGLTWTPSDRLRLVVSSGGVTSFAGPTATGRAGLRKGNCKLYFWDAGDRAAASSWVYNSDTEFFQYMPGVGNTTYSKRIQSVSIDVTWNRTQLEQLGEHEPYDRGVENTEITTTISAIGSDAELFAIASGNANDSTGWSSDEVQQMNLSQFQNATNLALRVDVFNTTDVTKHTAANRCKSILLTGGKVTTFGESVDVPGRTTTDLTVTFNGIRWMGDKIIANRAAV